MSNKALLVVTKNTDNGNTTTLIDDIVGGMKVTPVKYYDYENKLSVKIKTYVLTLEEGDEFKVKDIDKVLTITCEPNYTHDNVIPRLLFRLESSSGEKTVTYDEEEIVTILDDSDFKEIFDMYSKYTEKKDDLNINTASISHKQGSTVLYVPDQSNFALFELKTGFEKVDRASDYTLEEIYNTYANVMDGKSPYSKLNNLFKNNMYIISAYGVESYVPTYNIINMHYSEKRYDTLHQSMFKLGENVEIVTHRNIHKKLDNDGFTINVEDNQVVFLF